MAQEISGGSVGQPGGGGGLGDRLFNWLRDVWGYAVAQEPLHTLTSIVNAIGGAIQQKQNDASQFMLDALANSNDAESNLAAIIISSLTGKPLPKSKSDIAAEMQKMLSDPQGYIASKMKQIETDPSIKSAAADLTALIHDSVLAPLKIDPNNPVVEPLELAAEVLAGALTIKTAAGAVGTAAEILGLGQIKSVSDALIDMTDAFSPGQIINRVIDPMLAISLVPAVERFYNAQFRPQRVPARDLAVLLGFGVIDASKMATEAAEEGWRDDDIALIQQLVQQRVTPDDAQTARDLGMIDDTELFNRLKFWRYSDDDAQFEMNLAALSRHITWNERMLSILLRQYLAYRLDDNKLETILRTMQFPDERVAVELAAAKAARDAQEQDLSVGEIEAAYKANVLSDVEAANYLAKIQVDPSGVSILLRTWKAAQTKGGTHLNATILTRAYHDGLIDEQTLGQKLRALGWNSEDARLLVQIATYQKPPTPKSLTEASITSAYTRGILSNDEAISQLKSLGMDESTAALVLRIHTLMPRHSVKTLTAAEVAKAVELGAIGENEALNRFEAMGYSSEDAALLFVVLTNKVPRAVKTQPPSAGG